MKTKNLLAAGAVVASMAGGGVAGALLFTPQLSGAQETTTTTVAAAPHLGGHRFGLGGGAQLSVAATAIGISEADLRTALQGGKTIAEVAKDHDVDVQKVIDALVSAATKRIDQAVTDGKLTAAQATDLKAKLKDSITAFVNGTRPEGFGHHGFGGRGFGGPGFSGAGVAPGASYGA